MADQSALTAQNQWALNQWDASQTGQPRAVIDVRQMQEPPEDCSDDVHVFPCPRCAICKCGKATLTGVKGDNPEKQG